MENASGPVQTFEQRQSSGALILLIATALAVLWVNTPARQAHFFLWYTDLTISLGTLVLSKPLLLWINEGLMAALFFVLSHEVKREFVQGELRSIRAAALPVAAALGGVFVPAAVFLALNWGKEGQPGWGIPVGADVALSLGMLTLLGDRIPRGLRKFAAATAILSALIAAVPAMILHATEPSTPLLIAAAVLLLILIVCNRAGVRGARIFGLLSAALWFVLLPSGVNASLAGVLAALMLPVRNSTSGSQLQESIHPFAVFFVLPMFVLANAGLNLEDSIHKLAEPVGIGVMLGLLVGKPLGITLFSLVAVSAGIAVLPEGVTRKHLMGAGFLGGIGFTMSLFIAGVVFTSQSMLATIRTAVFAASILSAIAGWLILRRPHRDRSS